MISIQKQNDQFVFLIGKHVFQMQADEVAAMAKDFNESEIKNILSNNPWTFGNWKLENAIEDFDHRKRLLLWHQDKMWHILQEEAITIGILAKNQK
jgi:hypothetical protein